MRVFSGVSFLGFVVVLGWPHGLPGCSCLCEGTDGAEFRILWLEMLPMLRLGYIDYMHGTSRYPPFVLGSSLHKDAVLVRCRVTAFETARHHHSVRTLRGAIASDDQKMFTSRDSL